MLAIVIIILIVILSVSLILVSLAGIAIPIIWIFFILYGNAKANERRQIQRDIIDKNKQLLNGYSCFPVCYASNNRPKRYWRGFSFESTGTLFVNKTKAIFLGNAVFLDGPCSKEEIKIEFPKEDTKIEWIGMTFFWSKIRNWFSMQSPDGKKHWFTSETGLTALGSGKATKEVYNSILELFDINKQ